MLLRLKIGQERGHGGEELSIYHGHGLNSDASRPIRVSGFVLSVLGLKGNRTETNGNETTCDIIKSNMFDT